MASTPACKHESVTRIHSKRTQTRGIDLHGKEDHDAPQDVQAIVVGIREGPEGDEQAHRRHRQHAGHARLQTSIRDHYIQKKSAVNIFSCASGSRVSAGDQARQKKREDTNTRDDQKVNEFTAGLLPL